MRRVLPKILAEYAESIAEYARLEGLDFYPTIFEMLESDEMSQVAAYGGFPQRYPHWRFGMEYDRLRKQHTYGLGKIYEMVINNDPCYAYLLRDNVSLEFGGFYEFALTPSEETLRLVNLGGAEADVEVWPEGLILFAGLTFYF